MHWHGKQTQISSIFYEITSCTTPEDVSSFVQKEVAYSQF